MDGTSYALAFASGAATRLRIVFGEHLDDLSVIIRFIPRTFNDITSSQTNFVAGEETVVLFRRVNHEVIALDQKMAREGQFVCTGFGFIRHTVDDERLCFILRVVRDRQLDRVKDCHRARCAFIQIFPQTMLEKFDINHAVDFRDAVPLAEIAYGARRVTAAAQPG